MSSRFFAVSALAFLTLLTTEQADAFDPRGRTRKKPTTSQPAPARRAPPKPTKPPSDEALIRRYTGIVLNQPGAQFPLQRLATLYRERDGNLDKLIAEFEARVEKPDANPYNALVALAGIYAQANRFEQAQATYDRAVQLQPQNPIALMALGHLYAGQADKAKAHEMFQRALPQLKGADREQTLRLLMGLSLDLKDVEGARAAHQELVSRAKGSFFVRAELGRELLARGMYAEAEAEQRQLVQAARGDHRAEAPALRDLARALAKQGKQEEALTTLKQALRITGSESGLRREIFDILVEVYRDQERLAELVALLEAEKPGDFQRLRLLASLYEETGRIADAIKAYRAALDRNRGDLEARLKLVQLLQIQGELDAAIAEYRELIRAAPHNPDFVFRLAEALLQRGDRQGAIQKLRELERASQNDEQTLAALVDFYERVGEEKRALSLLQRLSQNRTVDPFHTVELGKRYYQQGDTEKAKATWKRILTLVPERARALHILGEVYLEHDMPELALESLKEAVELAPEQRRYKKALALALERTGSTATKRVRRERHEQARRLWEQLLVESEGNRQLEQEARQHIVTLWSLSGTLQSRLKPLERNLAAKPPDLSSGRLLGEMYIRLRRYPDAERVLRRVAQFAPGDVGSQLRLERVLVLQRKLPEAITVLKKLVEAEPKRAREYYQRMAKYAAELYRDDEAIEYAAKAVELSPDDALGHKNLGEMYKRRQDTQRAIAEYRKAIAKNDRLFPVYFDLAELLISQQQTEEADKLLRRVMRSAVDEELVSRATRLSMQLNLGRGTLESLEKELLPVALGNPQRPIYRRLLVEIYGALAFPLVQKTRNPDPAVADAAQKELRRIGQRAVKPLLDALGDPRDSQQRVAIELLTHLENKSATAALYAYATGEAEPDLRVRAMIAAGAPADENMVERFEQLLTANGEVRVDEGDPVSIAAVWGLAKLKSAKANRVKWKMLESDAPSARALAALSLGLNQVRAAKEPLLRIVESVDQGPVARAAAVYALGELDAVDQPERLFGLTHAADDRLRAAALTTLARGGVQQVKPQLAEALVHGSPALRKAATGAAASLATGAHLRARNLLGTPAARVQVDEILQNFHATGYSADGEAQALSLLANELAAASSAAVQSSAEQARTIADALLSRPNRPSFGTLTAHLDEASPAHRQRAEAAAESIAAAVTEPFLSLARHPAASVRTAAVEFLATRPEPRAQKAVEHALMDKDAMVQRVALASLARNPSLPTLPGIVQLLTQERQWPTRVVAAETIRAYSKLDESARRSSAWRDALSTLAERAEQDRYSLVREAAILALHQLSPEAALPVLRRVAEQDPEPRVRATASELLP